MTQPTQAQIEAAAKAISEKRPVTYTQMAIVALTAAAQVGEPKQEVRHIILTQDATIERCAQVAENYNAAGKPIAAAIRRLKDAS